jgi:hypothetical protein
MAERALTPHTTVTIGQQTRVYLALATTAPSSLDSAGTVSLRSGTLADLALLAPLGCEEVRMSARRILVAALDLAWHRAPALGTRHNCCWSTRCSWALNRCRDGCGSGWGGLPQQVVAWILPHGTLQIQPRRRHDRIRRRRLQAGVRRRLASGVLSPPYGGALHEPERSLGWPG